MALRNIRKDGDEVLRKQSKKVENFDSRLGLLIDDMIETLHDTENGVGLAAPQVGVLKSVIVVDLYDEMGTIVAVNPEITAQEGECTDAEGCLSVPFTTGEVKRPERITVKYKDRNGNDAVIEAEGFLARVFCHEIDHLHGILFIDKAMNIVKDEPAPTASGD